MSSKWYSTLSTGILELDCQHQNLDTLLSLVTSSTEEEAMKLLRIFEKGLSSHFRLEESMILPDGTPLVDPRHEKNHREVETLVQKSVVKVDRNPEMIDSVAMELCSKLISHAANYDIPATKARPAKQNPGDRPAETE